MQFPRLVSNANCGLMRYAYGVWRSYECGKHSHSKCAQQVWCVATETYVCTYPAKSSELCRPFVMLSFCAGVFSGMEPSSAGASSRSSCVSPLHRAAARSACTRRGAGPNSRIAASRIMCTGEMHAPHSDTSAVVSEPLWALRIVRLALHRGLHILSRHGGSRLFPGLFRP